MRGFRFFSKLTGLTLGKLCQQRMLLAGVALLCFLLPLILGPMAETALSRGISFSGVTLAITAPEEARIRRIMARDGICREYALSRFSPEAKAANIAEFVAHICALAENNKKESK